MSPEANRVYTLITMLPGLRDSADLILETWTPDDGATELIALMKRERIKLPASIQFTHENVRAALARYAGE
jgi:hypothetical protein